MFKVSLFGLATEATPLPSPGEVAASTKPYQIEDSGSKKQERVYPTKPLDF